MIFNILFLPVLFFIGLITSYEDIKYGKIRNKWIRFGLFWGLFVIAFFFLWYLIAAPVTRFFFFNVLGRPEGSPAPVFTVYPSYLLNVLLNSALSLFITFLMWRQRAWAAGDAKLFFIYSLLLPLGYYQKAYLPLFPSFALMINIFIPAILFLFFRSAWHVAKLAIGNFSSLNLRLYLKKKIAERASIKEQLLRMSGFLAIFTLFGLFSKRFPPIGSFQSYLFPALIIFSQPISRFLDKKIVKKIVFIFLGSVVIFDIVTPPPYQLLQIIFQSLQMMLIFTLVMKIFGTFMDKYIANEAKKGKTAFPMAAWMFFGFILTLFFKESLLSFIINLFK